MERNMEDVARAGSEVVADYVEDVLTAAGKLVDTLMTNVARLSRGVIDDAGKVVAAACDAFGPGD